MKILVPFGERGSLSLERILELVSGLEWWVSPGELGAVTGIPLVAKVFHLGDLRSPDVGDLTCRLRGRVQELVTLCQICSQIEGVVIHAESALGWRGGDFTNRRGFWEFLVGAFSGRTEVFVENNVLLRKGPRYDFIRDPEVLADELGGFGLRLALDTAHAAWFYQGWPSEALSFVGDATRVGHLHLGDWAPGGGPGRQHLPFGKGVLPIKEILEVYQGEFVTLEVRRGVLESLRFMRGVLGAR